MLIRPEAAADILGLSKNTLAKWRTKRSHALDYVKRGTRVFYDEDTVREFDRAYSKLVSTQ